MGKVLFGSSADDLFHADLILIWGGNPTYTQIPNAHFINEARYRGARVVTREIEIDLTLKNERGETPVVGTARISL